MKYDARLVVVCPGSLPAAIDQAATAKLMKPAEYVRRAIVDRLEADGISIAMIAPAA